MYLFLAVVNEILLLIILHGVKLFDFFFLTLASEKSGSDENVQSRMAT